MLHCTSEHERRVAYGPHFDRIFGLFEHREFSAADHFGCVQTALVDGQPSNVVTLRRRIAPEFSVLQANKKVVDVFRCVDPVTWHVQLVLTDRSTLTNGQSYGVYSQNVWRLADMGARHAFLRAGFGFGNMPRFMVEDDIASGKLRVVRVGMPSYLKPLIPMRAVYSNEAPPGPAGRWLIQHLEGRREARRAPAR
jgi:LysR substrate binding domain